MINLNKLYSNNNIDNWKRQYLAMLNDKTIGFKVHPNNIKEILDLLRDSRVAFIGRLLPLSYIKSKDKYCCTLYNEDYFVYITKKGNIHCELFNQVIRKKNILYKDFHSIPMEVTKYINEQRKEKLRRKRR